MKLRDKSKLIKFQKEIDYTFKNPDILLQALTTPQYGNELNVPHYEILETLGDAVIKLIFSMKLYKEEGIKDPGKLTQLKQCLENNNTFMRIALKMELWRYIYASKNQDVKNSIIMAQVFEAISGAVFLDANEDLNVVETKIIDKYFGKIEKIIEDCLNFTKNELLEFLQEKYKMTPTLKFQYHTEGAQHDLYWTAKNPIILDQDGNMLLYLPKNLKSHPCRTKKDAEKEISAIILDFLKTIGN